MPKIKSELFDQKQYINDYIKANIKYRRMNFNVNNTEDYMMMEWIDSQPEGVSNYLKKLVYDDMKRKIGK